MQHKCLHTLRCCCEEQRFGTAHSQSWTAVIFLKNIENWYL